ncbi:chitinase domain-containing protein 1 isoform X12 [Hemicordylus capensis]|uniref:chitinase domain-containing protein 1 isoform X12 n=1 Tax=Hemicordylus capensis TaxID=884348 RepID=UPI002304054E|nr:chitinase domain-containing protein 1 isoform X12 [Hemicordylus capensis]
MDREGVSFPWFGPPGSPRRPQKKVEVTGIVKPAMRCICLGIFVFVLTSLLADATLSKTDTKKAASKTLEEKFSLQTHHSDKVVQDRDLVVTDPKAKDIILEHKSYCAKKARERYFLGDVLGYITPWNNHGYDIAKIFGNKFTTISPVWLQVKRRGKEKFQITGLHDADKGWMKEVRKNAKNIKIVPRILFEDWAYHDFQSVFGSEDEIEELSNNMVQVAKNENFDGFVAEVWSQLGNQKQSGLIHLLTHLSEALHQARLKLILVIPPAVMPGSYKWLRAGKLIGSPFQFYILWFVWALDIRLDTCILFWVCTVYAYVQPVYESSYPVPAILPCLPSLTCVRPFIV